MSKKYKVTGWAIVATIERPDGTWFDNTITDFPEHIGITINEWLEDYKSIEEENLKEWQSPGTPGARQRATG